MSIIFIKEVRTIKLYKKGSITVEASILIPMIAVLIIFMITVIIVEYEKAIVRTTTENAAYAIAQHHNPKFDLDVDAGFIDGAGGNPFSAGITRKTVNVGSDFDLYWRLFRDKSYQKELLVMHNAIVPKLVLITGSPKELAWISSKNSFTTTSDRGDEIIVTISDGGGVIDPSIVVKSEIIYKIPLGVLIGIEEYVTHCQVTVPVVDNAEFIRNYGLAKDMAMKIPGVKEVLDKIEEITGG